MSLTYGFYNSLNHDRRYNAIQVSSIFDGIIKDGIFMSIGDQFNVTADGTSMFVTVGIGRAWFDHTWTLNDAPLLIEIPQSEVVLNRYDAVVLEVNSEQDVRKNDIIVVKGVPSAVPSYPELINSDTVHQYPLAYVYVERLASSIRQANVTSMIGKEPTPYVTGILETVNIEHMVAQWEDQWKEFFENQSKEMADTSEVWKEQWRAWFEEYTTISSEDFDRWYDHMKDQLSEDAAGNIQMQLDALYGMDGIFSEDIEYVAGDYCLYKNVMYKFTADKSQGVWDPSIVSKTSIFNELKALGGLRFMKIRERDYEDLPVKDENTVYFSPKEE